MRNAIFYILIITSFLSCRHEEKIVPAQDVDTGGEVVKSHITGMYLLNEGNMGSNKSTLDFLDLSGGQQTVHYYRNIYSERNPTTVMSLGDVGNDIKIYGSRLWMVINCSNKVEVARAGDAVRIGQVNIPNCRYLAFHDRYAYVSSYVGPVAVSGNVPLGWVYMVVTLSLQKVDSVVVGYQPEEMAVVGNRLYVANSGGYRVPVYDNTISVIDLSTMTEVDKIVVAKNLHRLKADRFGQLWVTSRGDYSTEPSCIYWLSGDGSGSMRLTGSLDVSVSDMCIVDDQLYYYGNQWNDLEATSEVTYGIINVRTHEKISTTLFDAPEIGSIRMPYGIIVNPINKDFYLMDAKNYVSSGELLHFLSNGTFDWRVWTGDIPAHATFLCDVEGADFDPSDGDDYGYSKYLSVVDEYVPAPGQHVNVNPDYEEGDTPSSMAHKCTLLLAGNAGHLVSLGGFGGYITFHFDHPVANVEGQRDFAIWGNAYQEMKNIVTGGNNEAGIIMVSQDTNGNGLPDDDWYELSGSCDVDSVGKMDYGYQITYQRVPMGNIPWTDNRGESGFIYRNQWHEQEYYPQWLPDRMTFGGTRLPQNGWNTDGQGNYWVLVSFRYGYADNHPNLLSDYVTLNTEGCGMDIGWAVDAQRQPVRLEYIDFVRVYTGLNQHCGWLGETSTEIQGAEDLHLDDSIELMEKRDINSSLYYKH